MRADLTDITLVVDRSGSMDAIRDDAEGGVNAFIAEQAQAPGDACLTLVQFDTEYEFLEKGTPIREAGRFRLQPRGGTALLDAVGRAMQETGERLASLPEAERPGLVIFVVMTDGQENSSREYTKAQIKKMIEHQQSVYSWQFTFLGANQDAFAEAESLGIMLDGAAEFSPMLVAEACMATGEKVARMRKQKRAGEVVVNAFTEEERKRMS
ncbi:MAG: vWA domain-containing protein [Pirellulales bacterium]